MEQVKNLSRQRLEWEVVGEGVKRKIMGYDDKIMLVKVQFDEGGIGINTNITILKSPM